MTLHFKIITGSSASAFEKDMNDFMANNSIMDAKFVASGANYTAFLTYCTNEEIQRDIEQKVGVKLNVLNSMLQENNFTSNLKNLTGLYSKDK